jgi:two-component system sensor histidine kinase KdpD
MADMPKPAKERILVCVSPNPSSPPLITAAGKMAASLHAEWSALHVEQPKMAMLPEAERNRAAENLRLAGRLGAETVTRVGRNVAMEIVDFARQRNATRIIMGKPARAGWRAILHRSPVDRVVRISRDIDVYVTAGEPAERLEPTYVIRPEKIRLADYGAAFLYLILATAICFAMFPYLDLANLIMVYLVAVMLTATGCGRGPAVLTSLLSVLAFDFFFVPPRFSFTVEESEYIVTFVVMAVVALVISHLAAGMRQQAAIARLQEREAAAMHGLSRQLASARGVETILQLAVRYISDIFDCQVSVLLPDENRNLRIAAGELSSVIEKGVIQELAAAHAAYDSGEMAGRGTQTAPMTDILYVPLRAGATTWGVLALRPRDPGRFQLREQVTLLDSLSRQLALALEVERMSVRGFTAIPTRTS